jgi:HPt (histidine-containing phosphotransfer) domain-containing protein
MDGDLNKPGGTQLLCSATSSVAADQGTEHFMESAAIPEFSREAAWDFEELMLRLDGDQEFLRELLVIFQQDAWSNVEKSCDAISRGDFEALARAAHTLKGILRNQAMGRGGGGGGGGGGGRGRAPDVAAALEEAARKALPEAWALLLPQLQQELEGLLPEVEAQLAEVKP